MRRALISFSIVLLISGPIAGIEPGDSTLKTPQVAKLPSLAVGGISFFHNSEFFNPYTQGATFPGSHLRTSLFWSPEESVSIAGGVDLRLWSGRNSTASVRPIFTVRLRLSESLKLSLGTLEGPDSHRLFDPIYRKEKLYTNFTEEGIRLLYEEERLWSDTWIDWEKIIFHGDRFREKFTFGQSLVFNTNSSGRSYQVLVPVQILARHWGGQISDFDERVKTHFNMATGANITFYRDRADVSVESLLFGFYNSKPTEGIPLERGGALWVRGGIASGNFSGKAGLWVSDDFYAPRGNMMFSSISDYRPEVIRSDRTLLTANFDYRTLSAGGVVELYIGMDLYYDPVERNFNNAINLHIRLPERLYKLRRDN